MPVPSVQEYLTPSSGLSEYVHTLMCTHTHIYFFFFKKNKSISRPLINEDFLFGVVIFIFPYNKSKYCVGARETDQKARMLVRKAWGPEVRAPATTCMPGVATTARGRDRWIVGLCRLPAYLQSQWENCLKKNNAKSGRASHSMSSSSFHTHGYVHLHTLVQIHYIHFLSHTQNTTCFLFTFIVLSVTGQFSFSNHQWTSLRIWEVAT